MVDEVGERVPPGTTAQYLKQKARVYSDTIEAQQPLQKMLIKALIAVGDIEVIEHTGLFGPQPQQQAREAETSV